MPQARLMTAQSAATRLGISRATLYAYVSRGLVHAHPDANDPRRRLYSADDINRLAGNKARGRKPSDIAASTLDFGLVACPDLVPDLWRVVDAIVADLEALVSASGLDIPVCVPA